MYVITSGDENLLARDVRSCLSEFGTALVAQQS